MQEGNNKNNDSNNPACISRIEVSRCRCGSFHLRYRYVDVAVRRETLYLIMEECFRYEKVTVECGRQNTVPMIFSLGVVTLTIMPMDYAAFSKAIGDAVSDDLGLKFLFTNARTDQSDRPTGSQN